MRYKILSVESAYSFSFLICIFISLSCSIVCSKSSDDEIFSLLKKLESKSPEECNEALEKLFLAGENAIPNLISNFGNRKHFHGVCGSDFEWGWEFVPIGSEPKVKYSPSEIREISLFLIIAIYEDNLGARGFCSLKVEKGDREETLDKLFIELANEQARSIKETGKSITLEVISAVMRKHNVKFNAYPIVKL